MKYKWFVALAVVFLTVVSAQADTNVFANNEKVPSAAVPAGDIGLTNSSVSSPAVAGSTNKEEIVFFDDLYRKTNSRDQIRRQLFPDYAEKRDFNHKQLNLPV